METVVLWPGQRPGVHDHKPYDECYEACPGRLAYDYRQPRYRQPRRGLGMDVEAYRARLLAEARRLGTMPLQGSGADLVTEGRHSGLYLALSILREFEKAEEPK